MKINGNWLKASGHAPDVRLGAAVKPVPSSSPCRKTPIRLVLSRLQMIRLDGAEAEAL